MRRVNAGDLELPCSEFEQLRQRRVGVCGDQALRDEFDALAGFLQRGGQHVIIAHRAAPALFDFQPREIFAQNRHRTAPCKTRPFAQ